MCHRVDRAFLSTLSLRRATNARPDIRQPCAISIHALLAESDYILVNTFLAIFEFLSTLSLRRATDERCKFDWNNGFLSTLSLRRATRGISCKPAETDISIHALLAESDLTIMLYDTSALIFLSTLSLRRATPSNAR